MSLSAGTRLGPYEIVAPLGAGGMGEVYRARDARLERDVAIKVLPQALAQDADRLARFEREAKALAALNHPNIAAIYGVEERALVMELVEGEDLRGPLPVETALHYARQIAEALEAAHEKGIVHRDLKPANIKVTPQGAVKVLDFGLAAIAQGTASSAGDPASSPTLTMRATQAGLIMGTAAYMSPEQAAGKPVDRRADIWSFGVVLWEMLAGRRLFDGETVSHTLADVLRSEIDLAALPPETPPAVRALLGRCLDRNVRNRLRDIGEARVALDLAAQPSAGPAPAQPQARPAGKLPWMVAAAAVAAVAVLGALYWRATQPVMRPAQRFDIPFALPERLHSFLAISPDGTRLAYVARGQDGVQRIYTRLLDQPEGVSLAGTDGAMSPFFSPDGQWLAFAADGSLKKILVQGGAAVKLCDAPDMRGGSWGDDGNIVFTPDNRAPLYRVPESGGAPQRLTQLTPGEFTHRYPQVLPGAREVLFTVNNTPSNFEESSIRLLDVASGKIATVHQGGFGARYLPSGHLLWAHEGALFGAAFDAGRARIQGPIPLLEKLADDPGSGLGNFEVSPAGIYVGVTGSATLANRSLAWVDSTGKIQPVSFDPKDYSALTFSPDGKRVAVVIRSSAKSDIFIHEVDSERLTPLTFTGQAVSPVWAPDGKHIAFSSLDRTNVYRVRTDGSGAPELLFTATDALKLPVPDSFSPDGKVLVLSSANVPAGLWLLRLDLADPEHAKTGKPEPLSGSAEEIYGAFSPDGQWLAYMARGDHGTGLEVYVEPFPPTGGKWRISTDGGRVPIWSRTSRELFFTSSGNNQIMVAGYRVEGKSFVAGKPRLWTGQAVPSLVSWDIAPDGKRAIATIRPDGKPGDTRLTFLLNFTDELRRRVPGGRR